MAGWWFGRCLYFFHSVGNVIIPTDELIFFRGVGQPPTRWSHGKNNNQAFPKHIGWGSEVGRLSLAGEFFHGGGWVWTLRTYQKSGISFYNVLYPHYPVIIDVLSIARTCKPQIIWTHREDSVSFVVRCHASFLVSRWGHGSKRLKRMGNSATWECRIWLSGKRLRNYGKRRFIVDFSIEHGDFP